ncbi:MAG: PVC-type heme-binding CxxCH protein, partial [Pirellulales bacterium]
QNEDTHKLPDGVDRMSFADMLGMKPARPKLPEVSLRNIEVPEGFEVQLVAAEPLIADPVAMDWGPDGRLWVVEMADYPLGVDGKGAPGGRVRWLSDTDGDGVYDRSTLFLENLSTPTGIMVWREGILITAAPDVLYAEDTDGDGKADRKEVLFTGFGKGNQQHRVNGLCWGLDNWIYLANGDSGGVIVSNKTGAKVDIRGRDVRIRPDEGLVEAVEGQTQFGRSRDDWGNWFGCNNPNPIFHYVLADRYLRRNPHFSPPAARRDIRDGSTSVFPISQNISHCDTKHRPLGAAATFTSANSTIVYRGGLFGPDFVNNTFTSEPVYNVVHRRVLEPRDVTFRSLRPKSEAGVEFFRSSDAWCRPTGLRVGPNGGLYIADMYREVIEHPEWINDELEQQIDVRAGHDRGRIYRVAPVGEVRMPPPEFDKRSTTGLVGLLRTANGWRRDIVHRMLIWRNDRTAIAPLEKMAAGDPNPLARLHALCALDGLQAVPEKSIIKALSDPDYRVRRHAIRLSEPFLAKDNSRGGQLAEKFLGQHPIQDPHVQLQLAYSAGSWDNPPAAGKLLGELALKHIESEHHSAAVMSSVNAANVQETLAAVLLRSAGSEPERKLIDRLLAMGVAFGKKDAVAATFTRLSVLKGDRFTATQFRSLASLLDALSGRKLPLDELLEAGVKARVAKMFAQARRTAIDESSAQADRLAAVALLGRDAAQIGADIEHLIALLGPQSGPAIHSAAVQSLARLSDERIPRLLLAAWNSYSPALRARVLNVLLSRAAGTKSLLEAMREDKQIAAHLDATGRQRLLNHGDVTIRQTARKLLSGPAPTERAAVVERHRDLLELSADADRGRVVFQKRCATCHKLEGVGHNVGPDLTAVKDRSAVAMLTALLDPNAAVEDKYLGYEVITTAGRILNGIIAEEGNNHIVLRDQNGKQHDILRTRIDELRVTGMSLMPEGLEKDLSKQDLADVIGYLQSHGPPPKSFPGNRPAVVRPDEADGTLTLTTNTCRIYGSEIRLEERYRNLGFWSSDQDRAVWTINPAKAGQYEVQIDFACAEATSGNRFVLSVGPGSLQGSVPSTGTWDNYQKKMIGKISIPAGTSDVTFRSDGVPKGYLIDLRSIRLIPAR